MVNSSKVLWGEIAYCWFKLGDGDVFYVIVTQFILKSTIIGCCSTTHEPSSCKEYLILTCVCRVVFFGWEIKSFHKTSQSPVDFKAF